MNRLLKRRRMRELIVMTGALCLLCLIAVRDVSAAAQPIEDFMKLKPKWNELVGSKFYLEGRVNGGTENLFGLMGCPLEFRMKEKVPKFEGRKEVIEVNAELARDERTMGPHLSASAWTKRRNSSGVLPSAE